MYSELLYALSPGDTIYDTTSIAIIVKATIGYDTSLIVPPGVPTPVCFDSVLQAGV